MPYAPPPEKKTLCIPLFKLLAPNEGNTKVCSISFNTN